jgi:subtilisin family serine protease
MTNDAHKPSLPISYFSSAGPTRDGREKPEVSAPGHAVLAAKSRSRTGVTRMSGTSMAAPAVTGTIALLLAEARARHQSVSIDQIRQALIASARHNPPQGSGWDPRYGHGRVSAQGAVASVIG